MEEQKKRLAGGDYISIHLLEVDDKRVLDDEVGND